MGEPEAKDRLADELGQRVAIAIKVGKLAPDEVEALLAKAGTKNADFPPPALDTSAARVAVAETLATPPPPPEAGPVAEVLSKPETSPLRVLHLMQQEVTTGKWKPVASLEGIWVPPNFKVKSMKIENDTFYRVHHEEEFKSKLPDIFTHPIFLEFHKRLNVNIFEFDLTVDFGENPDQWPSIDHSKNDSQLKHAVDPGSFHGFYPREAFDADHIPSAKVFVYSAKIAKSEKVPGTYAIKIIAYGGEARERKEKEWSIGYILKQALEHKGRYDRLSAEYDEKERELQRQTPQGYNNLVDNLRTIPPGSTTRLLELGFNISILTKQQFQKNYDFLYSIRNQANIALRKAGLLDRAIKKYLTNIVNLITDEVLAHARRVDDSLLPNLRKSLNDIKGRVRGYAARVHEYYGEKIPPEWTENGLLDWLDGASDARS